jgi:hypothetical protein
LTPDQNPTSATGERSSHRKDLKKKEKKKMGDRKEKNKSISSAYF